MCTQYLPIVSLRFSRDNDSINKMKLQRVLDNTIKGPVSIDGEETGKKGE